MRDYNISIDNEAMNFIKNTNIERVYITIKYIKGPCNDNLCKLIPEPEIVYALKDQQAVLLKKGVPTIYCTKPVFDSIQRYGGKITIKYSRLRKKLVVKGLTYNF